MTNSTVTWTIYTDGSCITNPGHGGYAAIIQTPSGNEVSLWGHRQTTTNNRMEMLAVLEGLSQVYTISGGDDSVTVITDSKYVMDGCTKWCKDWARNNWQRPGSKELKNAQLWELLWNVVNKFSDLKWKWVKAHSGNAMNNRADKLAKKASQPDD